MDLCIAELFHARNTATSTEVLFKLFRRREALFCGYLHMMNLGAIKLIKNSFAEKAGREENKSVLWIANVLLLLNLKEQADFTERECVFLQYMECTRWLDDAERELRCVCVRWSTTEDIHRRFTGGDSMGESTKTTFSDWFGLKPLSIIRVAVHVVRRNYGVKPFGGALAWPYHRFYLKRLYKYEKLTKHSV